MILTTAALCLALNVFHESRGETIPGQYGVALVTLNRAEGDEGKVCDEVFKRHQFSWTSGVTKTSRGWEVPSHMVPKDKQAWSLANTVARVTLAGRMSDFTQGATFYHADYVKPYWRKSLQKTKQIGRHLFYRSRSVTTD